MTKSILLLSMILVFSTSCAPDASSESDEVETAPPHVVFVTGDEEYRSEESMPMLAKILKREMGATITICYALDSAGFIDPNRSDHIAGLEALRDADLMVMFTRFRALPMEEAKYILDYAESGKPMVGFRTSTHAFKYEDSTMMHLNDEWPTKVFGQQWITHHGHFEDGHGELTEVALLSEAHPILKGVEPFKAFSWLYHVDGGDWKLFGDSQPLLEGTSLRSKHEAEGRLDQFPLTNPVAWTKSYTGDQGRAGRVFFTTLGHPYDFKNENMRRLALNGIFWALGKENEITTSSLSVEFTDPYEPNNSGFGEKYKKGQRPILVE